MIHIESIEFPISRKVDAGLTLDIEYNSRRVHHRLLARQRG
jgi:hypothetical protein